MKIDGGCHCGNLRFELQWPDSEKEIVRRMCGCSFCRMHGGAWTSHRDASLNIRTRDAPLVSKYQFGTKTAGFMVCAACGVVPFVTCDIDGTTYGIVNVNTFDDTAGFTVSAMATDFDGEDTGSRLERRQRNWIPSVRFDSKAP
jgi:hypothetical protein